VTVLSSPKGLPTAIAQSPTCKLVESPKGATGNFSPSIFTTAKSENSSSPFTCPAKVRPSFNLTVTLSAPLTTWALVRTIPWGSIINPEPSPC
jgi:hypothetical protein